MITGIGQVVYRITDLKRALDLYCDKVGFRIELMQIMLESAQAAADASL